MAPAPTPEDNRSTVGSQANAAGKFDNRGKGNVMLKLAARNLVICAAAISGTATPALARDGGWYLEADAGITSVNTIHFSVATPPGVPGPTDAVLDTKTGTEFGGIIGHDFGAFRLEAEASTRRVSNRIGILSGPNFPTLTNAGANIWDGANTKSLMFNGLVDIGDDTGLQGFVGGGLGIARVKHKISINFPGPTTVVDDADSGFAVQALAGVRYPLSDRIDLGLKYRYLRVSNIVVADAFNIPATSDWQSHSVLVTLAFNFGGKSR